MHSFLTHIPTHTQTGGDFFVKINNTAAFSEEKEEKLLFVAIFFLIEKFISFPLAKRKQDFSHPLLERSNKYEQRLCTQTKEEPQFSSVVNEKKRVAQRRA